MAGPSPARAASATAVLTCQGRAVADGRLAVGAFSDPVARLLLHDDERAAVDRVRSGEVPTDAGARLSHELLAATAVTMVPRTVAVDAAVREHAARQVVLLGAGLDARAHRMPELADATVVEVDHPASSRDKRERAAGLPTVGRVVRVEADLATEPLAAALDRAALDRGVATTWVWEGVVPYLTRGAVHGTAAQLGALARPGDRLVIAYQEASLAVAASRRVGRVALRLGGQRDVLADEPWRSLWKPAAMARMLEAQGFEVARDRTLLELSEGLGLPQGRTGSLRNGRVLVALRTPRPGTP